MTENDSVTELDEKIRKLEENFLRELGKIEKQRLKLERQMALSSSINVANSPTKHRFDKKAVRETLTVRLEPSLGEKLAKTRSTSDGLEDRLQETRIAFEDKLRTVDRMKAELERREKLLIGSIHQIETYLRAVFYLKQDADRMCAPLRKTQDEQRRTLHHLEQESIAWREKKESLLKAVCVFEPAKLHLQELISGSSEYSSIGHLVEYYLVLELLQEELLAKESQSVREEVVVTHDQQQMGERNQLASLLSQKGALFRFQSELKNLRIQITELEDQIDATTIGRMKNDAALFDLQKWIQKLYSTSIEYRPPEKEAIDVLNRMAGIRDFVDDALRVVGRLKSD